MIIKWFLCAAIIVLAGCGASAAEQEAEQLQKQIDQEQSLQASTQRVLDQQKSLDEQIRGLLYGADPIYRIDIPSAASKYDRNGCIAKSDDNDQARKCLNEISKTLTDAMFASIRILHDSATRQEAAAKRAIELQMKDLDEIAKKFENESDAQTE